MPLKTLTRQEFLKRKPQGDYAAYKRYIAPYRQARPLGTGVGKQAQLPMDPGQVNQIIMRNLTSGYMSPAQMRREATRSVQDAISSALGDLRGTTAAAQKQATDQARAYEGFAKALGAMRREDAGYVQDLYRGAAGDQARFAQALTGSVGAAAQADAAAQSVDVAAAGAGPYRGTDVPAMQNVGYYLGGQLPSASLAENAAYAAQNELRQGIALASRLGIEGAGMRQKAIDLQTELARERTKLTKGRPAAIREALKDLSDDQRANLATLANVAYLQNAQAKTTEEFTGMYQGQPSISTYVDAQGVTRRYNPNTHRVKTSRDGTQFLEPLPVAKSPSSIPRNEEGLTPSEQATATRRREEALQDARSEMLGTLQNRKGPLWNPVPAIAAGFREPSRKSYSQARQYLLTNFANDLIKQYPREKARILQVVDQVLASAGFQKRARAKATALPPGGLASLVGGFVPTIPKGR